MGLEHAENTEMQLGYIRMELRQKRVTVFMRKEEKGVESACVYLRAG